MLSKPGSTSRKTALLYAAFAYGAFVVAALWAIGFLAGRWSPTTVDAVSRRGSVWAAVLTDAGLLALFALQHSIMARATIKRRVVLLVGKGLERSTFVLAAALVLMLVFWQWQPLAGTVWHLHGSLWRSLLWAMYAAGWAVAIAATFMIDHLDFLGLRQAARHAHREPYEPPGFKERWLYVWVRHPMMTGLLIAFWATPVMSAGHLLFSMAASGYIAIGVRFEERDLAAELGDTYRDYARRVPAVVPVPRRRRQPVMSPEAGTHR